MRYDLKTRVQNEVIVRQELHYRGEMIGLHDTMMPFSDSDTIQEVSGSADYLCNNGKIGNRRGIHNVIENTLLTHTDDDDNSTI